MTQINRIYGNNGLNMVRPDQRPDGTNGQAGRVRPEDQVEISDAAQMLSRMAQDTDIRTDKIASVRQAIADGTYETPDKIDVVVNRILQEIEPKSEGY